MRVVLLMLCCVGLVACGDPPTPPPVVDVPALQTQAAAINAATTARAALLAPRPTPTPVPPVAATRSALLNADLAILRQVLRTDDPATLTPAWGTHIALMATITALPPPPH